MAVRRPRHHGAMTSEAVALALLAVAVLAAVLAGPARAPDLASIPPPGHPPPPPDVA